MQLIVHGGAGGAPTDPDGRHAALETAANVGLDSETPLGAVVSAVEQLERDPRFNAGIGSMPQSDGVARTDAGLMTSDRAAGAVCGLPGVAPAIAVARIVMEETPHVLLAGSPALDVATSYGVSTDRELLTAEERTKLLESGVPVDGPISEQLDWVCEHFGAATERGNHDTVGAVAHQGDELAAATATGGRRYALAGRVGDVPQIGGGFYCTEAGAASATGHGEDIARMTLCRRAVAALEEGRSPGLAATEAIDTLERKTSGTAGLIIVDERGRTGTAHNSEVMQVARASS